MQSAPVHQPVRQPYRGPIEHVVAVGGIVQGGGAGRRLEIGVSQFDRHATRGKPLVAQPAARTLDEPEQPRANLSAVVRVAGERVLVADGFRRAGFRLHRRVVAPVRRGP